ILILNSKSVEELELILGEVKLLALQKAKEDRLQAEAEKAADRTIFHLKKYQAEEPARKAQEEKDRLIFSQTCKDLEIGDNQANFGSIRSALGPDFTVFQMKQWAQSGAHGLSPASPSEQQQRREEKQQAQHEEAIRRQNWLKHEASPSELREAAKQEALENRQQARLSRFEQELVKGYEREVVQQGLPPLPKFWRGKELNRQGIHSLRAEELRELVKRYGSTQISARLHGVKSVGPYVFEEN